MDDSKKKPMLIGIIVACIVLAVVVTYIARPPKAGVGSMKRGNLVWVKCSNPDCGAEYQIDEKDYWIELTQKASPSSIAIPALTCKKCGEDSVYLAEKCPKCGVVFFKRETTGSNFGDKCPECGYSAEEERREKRAEERKKKEDAK